ncbi:hypothetical protein CBR_g22832 [Chara braunii]|uniref:Uncharacterized protein n=1 Tax=Chara braunii TaxID=69332 RepID=A0A388L2T0_CHABU|nr:hypothetical protein CBR_g22832 [Chara braunii]|eukprot:GBG76617.1 hypothetical protein CBR_g22832 [Chara braunii]
MDDMYEGEGVVEPDEPARHAQVPTSEQGRGADSVDCAEELPVHRRDANDGHDQLRSLDDKWRRARWTGDAWTDEPEVRGLCRSNAWWQQLKRMIDMMEPCYDFLRDMDRDGSSPPGLWDLQLIFRRKIDALLLDDQERAPVMEIVADRCAMMRQPAYAATYLLHPRRRDVSLLRDRSAPVLLSADRRPESRYIEVWADMVEDPPEEIDDTNVIPADVAEDDWELMDQVNRCKDGRNRITSVSTYDRTADAMSPWQDAVWMHREMMEEPQENRGRGKAVAEDQHDIFNDWATLDPHTDLDSYVDGSFQAVRTLRSRVGSHVDVEGLLATDDAEGAEEDIEHRHDDILASTSQPRVVEIGSPCATTSQHVNHPSSSRFARPTSVDSGGLAAHASAALDQPVEHRAQHREGVQQVVEQLAKRPGVRQSVVQTVDQRADMAAEESMGQRVEQRVGDSTDHSLYENAHPMDKDGARPMVVQTVEQRVGEGLAATVEQRAVQSIHPCAPLAADHRVEQRVEQRVEVRVDVSVEQQVDQGRSGIVRERVSERIDVSVVRDEGVVMTEDRMEDRMEEMGRDLRQESRARDMTLTRGSFYGIPPLPPRAAQSSEEVDLVVHCMSPAHRLAAQERASGGVRGAVDDGSRIAMQGGGRSLLMTSRIPLTSPVGIPPSPAPTDIYSPNTSMLIEGPTHPESLRPSSSRTATTPDRSPLGMPLLPARQSSAIRDNVKTSHVGRKKDKGMMM